MDYVIDGAMTCQTTSRLATTQTVGSTGVDHRTTNATMFGAHLIFVFLKLLFGYLLVFVYFFAAASSHTYEIAILSQRLAHIRETSEVAILLMRMWRKEAY